MDRLKQDADGANPIDAQRLRERANKDSVAAAKNAALLRPTVSQLATRYLGQYVSTPAVAARERNEAQRRRQASVSSPCGARARINQGG